MTLNELLETYRSLRTEDANSKHGYQRGPTSLASVWQEIFYSNLPISPFNLHMVLMYGIVSLEHQQESPRWKFKETKRQLESSDAVANRLQFNLQIKSA